MKTAYILGAIVSFTMIPVYFFTMMKATNWEEWIPIILFSALGVLCLVNYFIIHMEQVRKRENE